MKICKKCKKEYKEDYIYCPKCGQPYDDNMKRVKTPGDVSGSATSIIKLICNIILYIIGSITAFVFLITTIEMPVAGIIGVLFGLSLFPVFYRLIEEKTNINKYVLIAIRIVLPFILFITMLIAVPSSDTNEKAINKSYYCLYEDKTGKAEIEGLTYSYNFNHYIMENNLLSVETLIKYKFDKENSAYNYYKQNINDWNDYEVNLLDKEIMMFKKESGLKDRNLKSIISLQEKTGSLCYDKNTYIIGRFDSEYALFTSNKEKAKKYLDGMTSANNSSQNNNQQSTQNNNQTSEPAYMEYLRKCTVMEAYDIVTTGVGNKSGNAYVDAKKTCEGFYSSFGEKDFVDAVSTDWNSEQNNTINGKPLTECIKDLGW
ncbi:MAG: hypothetical protein IJ105_04130 [Bacilli bacterium]|nr:hypothetical protein [Bacilli bacterium]